MEKTVGVFWNTRRQRWVALLQHKGLLYGGKFYKSFEEAFAARRNLEISVIGYVKSERAKGSK